MVKLRSLAAKYLFVSAVVILFFSVYSLAGFVFTYYMEGDAKKINLAGRTRMLTYKIASHLHFIVISAPSRERERHDQAAELAMDEYEEVLYGLRGGSDTLGLAPLHPHDRPSVDQLNALISLWQEKQRPVIRSILSSPEAGGIARCDACHAAVRDNLPRLERFVETIENHHERELRSFNLFRLAAIVLLTLMAGALFIFTRRSLIFPVRQLSRAAAEIEGGNFNVDVQIRTRDEIGALGTAFNSMAQKIKALFTEKEEHLHELNMLNVISVAASQSLALDAMLHKVLDAILRLAPLMLINKGAIYLYDADRDVLELAVSRNYSDEQRAKCGLIGRGECLCGLCLESGRILVSENSVHDARHARAYPGMNEHGHIVLPIKSRGRMLGVLCFYLPAGTQLPDKEVRLYQSIADILAVSIQNALSHRQVAMLAQSLDSSMDLIIITDASGVILHVNPQAEKYLGYTQNELRGRHISLMQLRQDVAELWTEIFTRTLSNGKWQGEVINVRKDGYEHPVLLSTSLVKYESNTVIALIGIVRDITEAKRAEEALRRSEQRYRLLFDLLPYGGEVLDAEGRIIDCSMSTTRLLGYSRDELLGMSIADLMTPDSLSVFQEKFPQVMQGRPVEAEVRLLRKDGRIIDVMRAAQPIQKPDGTVTGALALSVDITDKKRAETEYRQIQSQFLQSQKLESIGRLAGGVAHDFNNLLTVIIGYSDIVLVNLDADSPLRERIAVIGEAGKKAAMLTRQLLAFSRRQTLELRPINLNEIIENIIRMLARMIGEDITLELKMKSSRMVLADAGQIEQILMNLAVNARDAMPYGGKVTLGTEDVYLDDAYAKGHEDVQPGNYVLLSVTDTGTGMSKEVQEKIFEPFYTTKEQEKGTGLGLATVYGIVKQHNGHIWVYSEVDKGTIFKVFLPTAEPVAVPVTAPTEAPPSRGSETIMVVDDEPVILALIKETLEHLGYRVIASSSGEEALRRLAREDQRPDLLLTDAIMPKMSGKDLADAARKILPGIKVIFMSGYPDESIAHHGILIPGVLFIQKPLMLDALARKIRDVLDGKEGQA